MPVGKVVKRPRLSQHAAMSKQTLELLDAEYHLMVARRRAEHYAPYSPAWDAAMEAVGEFEQQVSRLDDQAAEHRWLGIAGVALVTSSAPSN